MWVEQFGDDPTIWTRCLAVPEEPGTHVVLLDEATVLISGQRTADPRAL